jgi:hypothetical protein
MANKPINLFAANSPAELYAKDGESKKYSLIGGFLKIVRQKGAVRNNIIFWTRMC